MIYWTGCFYFALSGSAMENWVFNKRNCNWNIVMHSSKSNWALVSLVAVSFFRISLCNIGIKFIHLSFHFFAELDKSSSDVAAEGAILNEMLDIVAKRAALRANESQYGMNSIETDVSLINAVICIACKPLNSILCHKLIFCYFIVLILISICYYYLLL